MRDAKGCPRCGGQLDEQDCWNGCDEGYFDGYERDPLWYSQGDTYPCHVCNGTGVLYHCPTCYPGEEE